MPSFLSQATIGPALQHPQNVWSSSSWNLLLWQAFRQGWSGGHCTWHNADHQPDLNRFSKSYIMFAILNRFMAGGGVDSHLVSFVLLFEWNCQKYQTLCCWLPLCAFPLLVSLLLLANPPMGDYCSKPPFSHLLLPASPCWLVAGLQGLWISCSCICLHSWDWEQKLSIICVIVQFLGGIFALRAKANPGEGIFCPLSSNFLQLSSSHVEIFMLMG